MPDRKVLLVATARDVDDFPALRAYLGAISPKVASVRIAPIAASYVGVPHFVANPDGLVITNSLYTVTPRQNLSEKAIAVLVDRLNAAIAKQPRATVAVRYTPWSLEALEI